MRITINVNKDNLRSLNMSLRTLKGKGMTQYE